MSSIKVTRGQAEHFTGDLLRASGVDGGEAEIIARVLVWCQMIGRPTQGLWRLPVYSRRVREGLIKSPCRPVFEKKSDCVYLLNGGHGLGQYLGHVAMAKALALSKAHGVGVVGVRASNHFGAAAYFVEMAAAQSALGLAFGNSVPYVAAPGAISASLGTNPLAFGAPLRNGQSILADLSTGASSGASLRKAVEDNISIGEGIFVEGGERVVTGGGYAAMHPFGGAKGFCLGLMVEVLAGVITGSSISHEIASLHKNFQRSQDVGHLFVAIDVCKLMPIERYYDRIDVLIDFIKNSTKDKAVDEILLPGETRWRNYYRQLGHGVEVEQKTAHELSRVAAQLGVATPW